MHALIGKQRGREAPASGATRSLVAQSGQAKVRIGGIRIRRKAIVRAAADRRKQRDRLVAHALVG